MANLENLPTWRVAKVDASGEMTLKYEGFGDASAAAIEGYCFVIPVGGDVKGTALHWATKAGHLQMVSLLVKSGVNFFNKI